MFDRTRCVGTIVIVTSLALSASTHAGIAVAPIEFEDLFGPIGVDSLKSGPGTLDIEGIHFATSDILSFSRGKWGGNPVEPINPFHSDWFQFFCYNAGTTITFPQPITALSFDAAREDTIRDGTFRVFTGSTLTTTFTATWTTLQHVAVTFPQPVSTVRIQWVDGSGPSSDVGIDTLSYAVVPEPGSFLSTAIAVLAGSLITLVRRRRSAEFAAR